MRVVHVVPSVAPRYGGPSDAALRMVAALKGESVDALLVTTDADGLGRLPVELSREVDYAGSPTLFFSRLPGESLKPSPSMARWLGRNVAGFDLVHVHSVFSHPSLAAGMAARRSGVPYVVRPLGQLDRWSLSQHPLRKRLFLSVGGRRLVSGAAALHWTDESERENSPDFASSRPAFVAPLGVDEALFAEPGPDRVRRPVVLFLSRLHPKKNAEALIDAFLSAGDVADGWKLVIAGNGEPEYVDSLRVLVVRLGGVGCVEFVGWLSGEEKARAISEAAILVLPSSQENFGIAVAEAMAAGTPVVVSTAVALAREVERAGAGWVVPLEKHALRSALVEAMSSPEERRRRGVAARILAESRFRWGAVAKQLVVEYERILTRKAA